MVPGIQWGEAMSLVDLLYGTPVATAVLETTEPHLVPACFPSWILQLSGLPHFPHLRCLFSIPLIQSANVLLAYSEKP